MARAFTAASSQQISYPRLRAVEGAQRLAVSFWAQPTGSLANLFYNVWLGQMGGATGIGDTHGFTFQHAGGGASQYILIVGVRNNSTGDTHSDYNIGTSVWAHYFMQFDGSEATNANRVRLYQNGTLLTPYGSSGSFPTTVGVTDQPLILGNGEGNLYWSGNLSRCGVWVGTVLPSSDILQLSNGAPPWTVNPQALVWADDLGRNVAPRNVVSGEPATVTGTVSVADPTTLQPDVPSRFAQRVQPAWWLNATKVTEGA
jgi:hypothetical protein